MAGPGGPADTAGEASANGTMGAPGPMGTPGAMDASGPVGAHGPPGAASAMGELTWLLDNLVGRVGQIRQAVILSRDGMTMAASRSLNRDDAEHLSALAAGVQSLARGAGRQFNAGAVRQTIIEMEGALLFITAAGHGSCLAVMSSPDADVGLVAYEMALMVKRVGQHLTASARSPRHDRAAG